jgi:DNA processing protein
MYLNAWLAVCTHISSQLCKKWLPIKWIVDDSLLQATASEFVEAIDPRLASFEEVEESFDSLLNRSDSGFFWLGKFLKSKQISFQQLAEVFYLHLQKLSENGASYILVSDELYPKQLKTISMPPSALTVIGPTQSWNRQRNHVAVVGSRKASGAAISIAEDLGALLAASGHEVVSGGAFGCDIAAHDGCLKVSSDRVHATVVFAGGLEELYPKFNQGIFNALEMQRACFVSEGLWWQRAKPFHFLWRNRIIAGLGDITVLVEAAEKSGALNTCRYALDQGRQVIVWKGLEEDIRSEGNKKLIHEGAPSFSNIGEFLIKMQELSGVEN